MSRGLDDDYNNLAIKAYFTVLVFEVLCEGPFAK
jgi:hypothetical protein